MAAPAVVRPLIISNAPSRRSRTRASVALRIGILLFPALSACGEEPASPSGADVIRYLMPNRSRSGHFEAVGTNAVVKLEALGWAESIAGKVQRLMGKTIPFGNRSVQLVIEDRPATRAGSAEVRVSFHRGELVPRLVLCNPDALNPEDSCEALCRLLLNVYVFNVERATAPGESLVRRGMDAPPPWLSEGLAQNVYPELRSRNSQQCLAMWEFGEAITVAEILKGGSRGKPAAQAPGGTAAGTVTSSSDLVSGGSGRWLGEKSRAVYGVFLAWILSLPQHKECGEKILGHLANGTPITAMVLAPFIPGCSSAVDVEDAWDQWLLRQKRLVTAPGETSAAAVEQLDAELLLYPGVSGIPLDGDSSRPMRFRDLIGQRNAEWIPAFAAGKSIRLRLLGVGRGREFQDVVEFYCRFLDALGARKRESVLKSLLTDAEQKKETLGKAFGGAAAPPASESNEHKQNDRGTD